MEAIVVFGKKKNIFFFWSFVHGKFKKFKHFFFLFLLPHRSRPLASTCTTAHNTINSHIGMHASHTHTLNSSHGTTGTMGSASTNSSSGVGSGGGGGGGIGVIGSIGGGHQQPDILKNVMK